MRKLVLSCDDSLPTMQNAHRAGWDGVFFEYRDGEQLRTSAAYAARKGLFVQSVHAPFEDIWRLWEDAGEGGDLQCACTIEKTHPNDLGYYRMAIGIGEAVRQAITEMR